MAILNVSNEAQLEAALLAVNGGDTIRLAAGTYDKLEIASNRNKSFDFDEKVTITSIDSSNQAVINEMFIARSANIEIKNLELYYDGTLDSSTPAWLKGKPFFIETSSDITLDNLDFDGHLRNGYGADRGLRVVNAENVGIRNSDFSKFATAVELGDSKNVSITGSDFTNISLDGIRFGGMDGLRIEGNAFSDFRSAVKGENHKDAIQAGTSDSSAASSDIVIKGNDFHLAEVVHAIYLGNELVLYDKIKSSYHRNVLIEDNYIDSAHVWGIAVLHANGLTIRDNTLVQNPDKGFNDPVNVPLINVSHDSLYVQIQGNTAAVVPVPQNSTWIVSGNDTGTKNYPPPTGRICSRTRASMTVRTTATTATTERRSSSAASAARSAWRATASTATRRSSPTGPISTTRNC